MAHCHFGCEAIQGFAGVELSLGDATAASGGDASWRPLVVALTDLDLSVIMGVYTSWSDYVGPKEFVSMGTHKDRLRREVESALRLLPKPPVLFNAHSGCDRLESCRPATATATNPRS